MSEHTPLTEAERNALGPFIWGGWIGVDSEKHSDYAHDLLELVGQIKAAALAARTSAATADTGLRERVEALLSTWVADDEESLNTFGQHLMGGAVLSCAEHLQAVLDATAAPTTDTGARDE